MNLFLKSIIFLFIFSILHFGYEITGWVFLTPFCGVNESVFQHLKMAFWAYLFLAVLIEYPLSRKKMKKGKEPGVIGLNRFWYSRLLSAVILPWIILIIWYLLPAISGKAKSLLVDLVWAIGTTYLSALFVSFIEKDTEKMEFTLSTRYIILILTLISGFLFVWFTYRIPWVDLFINPENL